MLRIYLDRGDGSGRWMDLPASPEEMEDASAVLDASASGNQHTQVGDAQSSVQNLPGYLRGMSVGSQALKELDFLARRMDGMDGSEQSVFGAALAIENPRSLMELVNLSCNLDKFDHYPELTGEAMLGKYLVSRDSGKIPERLSALLDCESIGANYARTHAGCFTEAGYTVRSDRALEPLYDGERLPDPCYEKNSLLVLKFYAKGYHPSVYLPAPEAKLQAMAENIGVSSLDECGSFSIKENMEGLKDRLPCGASVGELNRLAAELAQVLDGTEGQRKTLFAALEAEAPSNIDDAIRIFRQLDQYEIVLTPEEFTAPSDYAHRAMEGSGQYYVDGFTAGYVDFEGLGKAMMKEDGAVPTSFGIVARSDHGIAQLPEEPTVLKLFSPLCARQYERDDWGQPGDREQEVYSCELCGYAEEIRKAVEKENEYLDGERGLAEYIDNKILNRKVSGMKPSVEVWNDELWGVLEVQVHGELSEGEMKELISEWSGQESDGWGENLEQQPIKTEDGELYVSFWHSGADFFIKPEQELKGRDSQGMGMQMGGM